jgi:hypothetical protein
VLRQFQVRGGHMDTVLLELGVASEADVLAMLGEVSGFRPVNLLDFEPNPDVASFIPPKIAERLCVVPLSLDGSTLHVACGYPVPKKELDEVGFLLGKPLELWVATELRVREWISTIYRQPLPPRFTQLHASLSPPAQPPPAPPPDDALTADMVERLARAVAQEPLPTEVRAPRERATPPPPPPPEDTPPPAQRPPPPPPPEARVPPPAFVRAPLRLNMPAPEAPRPATAQAPQRPATPAAPPPQPPPASTAPTARPPQPPPATAPAPSHGAQAARPTAAPTTPGTAPVPPASARPTAPAAPPPAPQGAPRPTTAGALPPVWPPALNEAQGGTPQVWPPAPPQAASAAANIPPTKLFGSPPSPPSSSSPTPTRRSAHRRPLLPRLRRRPGRRSRPWARTYRTGRWPRPAPR